MRVLWFSINSALFKSLDSSETGHGGWVSNLERIVLAHDDVTLGIAFEHTDDRFKVEQGGVTYYPMKTIRSTKDKLKRKYDANNESIQVIPACLKVIDDFKPDIIQAFGSEWCWGLLYKYTKIPILVHMQGSLLQYNNCRFPSGFSIYDVYLNYLFRPKKIFHEIIEERNQKMRVQREKEILSHVHYYMGRTQWDKNLTYLYNSNRQYFHVEEAISPLIYQSVQKWQPKPSKEMKIVTIGAHFLKGIDVIYKTMILLKQWYKGSVKWYIIGRKCPLCTKLVENRLHTKSANLNIEFTGPKEPKLIREILLNCDFYVHPAYAENSPNCICEAQLLGLPVIATFCGGINTLVCDGVNGILVPINDPYSIASIIIQLKQNRSLQKTLSEKELKVSHMRHSPEHIYNQLLKAYQSIIDDEKIKSM